MFRACHVEYLLCEYRSVLQSSRGAGPGPPDVREIPLPGLEKAQTAVAQLRASGSVAAVPADGGRLLGVLEGSRARRER